MWRLSRSGRIEELVVFKFRGDRYVPVGLLTFEGGGVRRVGRFVYAQSYLASRAAAIDPVGLPTRRGSRSAQPEDVQLAFHDSGPDGWGKGILDMAFPGLTLSMPEYLALGGTRRTGDLAYGPTSAETATWRPDDPPLLQLPADDDISKRWCGRQKRSNRGNPSKATSAASCGRAPMSAAPAQKRG